MSCWLQLCRTKAQGSSGIFLLTLNKWYFIVLPILAQGEAFSSLLSICSVKDD